MRSLIVFCQIKAVINIYLLQNEVEKYLSLPT